MSLKSVLLYSAPLRFALGTIKIRVEEELGENLVWRALLARRPDEVTRSLRAGGRRVEAYHVEHAVCNVVLGLRTRQCDDECESRLHEGVSVDEVVVVVVVVVEMVVLMVRAAFFVRLTSCYIWLHLPCLSGDGV